MPVRVTIRRRSEEVPEEFIYSVLMNTLKMNREEYEKIKNEDGSASLYVKDPEAILKLQDIGEKHSKLIEVIFEEESIVKIFSSSIEAVKSNWGLAFSWSAVMFILLLISLVPIIGFFVSVLTSAFIYAFTIYASSRLLKGSAAKVFKNLSLSEVFFKAYG